MGIADGDRAFIINLDTPPEYYNRILGNLPLNRCVCDRCCGCGCGFGLALTVAVVVAVIMAFTVAVAVADVA